MVEGTGILLQVLGASAGHRHRVCAGKCLEGPSSQTQRTTRRCRRATNVPRTTFACSCRPTLKLSVSFSPSPRADVVGKMRRAKHGPPQRGPYEVWFKRKVLSFLRPEDQRGDGPVLIDKLLDDHHSMELIRRFTSNSPGDYPPRLFLYFEREGTPNKKLVVTFRLPHRSQYGNWCMYMLQMYARRADPAVPAAPENITCGVLDGSNPSLLFAKLLRDVYLPMAENFPSPAKENLMEGLSWRRPSTAEPQQKYLSEHLPTLYKYLPVIEQRLDPQLHGPDSDVMIRVPDSVQSRNKAMLEEACKEWCHVIRKELNPEMLARYVSAVDCVLKHQSRVCLSPEPPPPTHAHTHTHTHARTQISLVHLRWASKESVGVPQVKIVRRMDKICSSIPIIIIGISTATRLWRWSCTCAVHVRLLSPHGCRGQPSMSKRFCASNQVEPLFLSMHYVLVRKRICIISCGVCLFLPRSRMGTSMRGLCLAAENHTDFDPQHTKHVS